MFNPAQTYPAPQMGGLGSSSPIMAAMLQKRLAQLNQPQQQIPQSTPAQTMGMLQGNSQNWGSSMPQQGLLSPNNPMPSPQIMNGN